MDVLFSVGDNVRFSGDFSSVGGVDAWFGAEDGYLALRFKFWGW
jgi:hypothetical protein